MVALTLGFLATAVVAAAIRWGHAQWSDWNDAAMSTEVLKSNSAADANEKAIVAATTEARSTPPVEHESSSPQRSDANASTAREVDDWDTLPRTQFDLVRAIEGAEEFSAPHMFRSSQLNPRDTKIPRSAREAIASRLALRAPAMKKLLETLQSVAAQELDLLVSSGNARMISYKKVVESLPQRERDLLNKGLESLRQSLQQRGLSNTDIEKQILDSKSITPSMGCADAFAYTTRSGDDNIYIGDLARMPQSRMASEAYYAAVLDLSAETLGFFRRYSCLTEIEESRITSRVEKAMAKYAVR